MSQSESILEPARQIPVIHECDICVVGGSCTGLFAAVRAARLGARVAVVEQQNCFGGMATTAMVNVWHSLYDTHFERQIIGGLTQEVLERLGHRNAVKYVERSASVGVYFNPEELKIELDVLATAARLKVFLHTAFVAVHAPDGLLDAIVVENKSGRSAIRAKVFIDASGDADLAWRMGLQTYRSAHPQPATMCAQFGGWDTLGALDWGRAIGDSAKAWGIPDGFVWGSIIPGSTMHMLAGTRVLGMDPTDADQLTDAEMEGRRQVRAIQEILHAACPEGRLVLQGLPSQIGLRESRHVRCRYQLTGDDVLTGRRFDDAIANGSYRVDVHHQDKPGITLRYLDGREEYCRPGFADQAGRWREPMAVDPTFYQIPFGSLVPEGASNVLVAGRMLDADATAYGAVRVMVCANQMGEAAGVGAWLALDGGQSVEAVDAQALRGKLAAGGSIII